MRSGEAGRESWGDGPLDFLWAVESLRGMAGGSGDERGEEMREAVPGGAR